MSTQVNPIHPILIVDDEEHILNSFEIALRAGGINNILTLKNSGEVPAILNHRNISVLLLDLLMPSPSGEEILELVNTNYPHIPVLVITGVNSIEKAVHCIKQGAYDYFVKPIEPQHLVSCVKHILELQQLRQENIQLKQKVFSGSLEQEEAFSDIVTRNGTMYTLFQYIETIAQNPHPVLITGETGVGKELIARAVHKAGNRTGDFVSVNIAGLDDHAFSDTLFGHLAGAFTDAKSRRAGMVETAADGTLFLDEIGDLNMDSQLKLLRLIQENEYYPLGSDMPKYSTCRFVFSTWQDLEKKMAKKEFRKDLYYRICTHHLHIPPLRDRTEDLPLLANRFLEEAAEVFHIELPSLPSNLYTLFSNYPFPGNVRELRTMIFDAVIEYKSSYSSEAQHDRPSKMPLDLFKSYILPKLTPDQYQTLISSLPENEFRITFPKRLPTLKQAEQMLIEEALRRVNGNQAKAARMLGLSRQALNYRLRQE